MADNKPTFHHLNNSQSQRIFWLLEELEIDYNLVLHERNPPDHPKAPFRSPPSLLAIGPMGTAPVLITSPADGSRYIAESSAIATYLIRTFDKEDKFGLQNGDWLRDEILCSVDTTLARATFAMLMIDMGILKNGDGPGGKAGVMDGPELRKVLGVLTRELKTAPPGGYFLGAHPGRADILLEYRISISQHRHWWLDLPKEFPEINTWLERCHARPAFKRSMEKGNGYDLSTFPNMRGRL